jgi:hypothetical protein
VDLLPRFASLDTHARKFSYDGVHMNEYGHKAMADILQPIVKAFASPARPPHRSERTAPGPAAEAGQSPP